MLLVLQDRPILKFHSNKYREIFELNKPVVLISIFENEFKFFIIIYFKISLNITVIVYHLCHIIRICAKNTHIS